MPSKMLRLPIPHLAALFCLAAALSFTACENPPQPQAAPPALYLPQLDAGASAPQPEILAPGVVSTANGERDAAFMPDGSAFFYTLWTGRFGVIVEMMRTMEGWTRQEIAPFSGRYSDLEPFVTLDGLRLFFASNRPVEPGGETKDYDIWYVERVGTSWGLPVHLDSTVNTPANEFYPTLDEEGTLYFTAAYENSVGGEDIWRCHPVGTTFGPRENVGPGVNTEHDEFNAFIAPDGSFLAFSSYGRDDGLGGGDLYVSFRDDDGQLGPALNAGAPINSVSLDGDLDIYVVDSSFLDSLKTAR